VHSREDRIARDDRQLGVKSHVRPDEEAGIADGGGIGIEQCLQALDVLVGGDPRGLPRHARFEQQAGLLHMLMALARRGHATNQARELSREELARGSRHAGACAAGDLDEALLLEREQRLPDRRAADSETLGQLLLGRHRRALLEFAGRDGPLDMLGDLVGPFSAPQRDRGQRCLHCAHSEVTRCKPQIIASPSRCCREAGQ